MSPHKFEVSWRIKKIEQGENLISFYREHHDMLRKRDPMPVRGKKGRLTKNPSLRVTIDFTKMDEATSHEFYDWFFVEAPFKGQYTTVVNVPVGFKTYVFRHESDALLMKMSWNDYVR